MRTVAFIQPKRLVFGKGCATDCAAFLRSRDFLRPLFITAPETRALAEPLIEAWGGPRAEIYDRVDSEPSVEMFEDALNRGEAFHPDVVVGLGGGSALDVAKLVAALLDSNQRIRDVFGLDLVEFRSVALVSLPTTSGTGSEVSPAAVLLDREERLKKGVVSQHLVPDAAFIDPLLTVSVPPGVTASTGLDALTHCIEAYANRHAHPLVDVYALEGMRLIAGHLERAVRNGEDIEARESMALGSLNGGLCLGPVNTAAAHALAYPLGGEFRVPHGLANAILLPHVMEFNLSSMPQRYAQIAVALGAARAGDMFETARRGIDKVRELSARAGIPRRLSDVGVPESAIPGMAAGAMKVTRLLNNNPRDVTLADAERIYRHAFV